jgi:hypothetical protein
MTTPFNHSNYQKISHLIRRFFEMQCKVELDLLKEDNIIDFAKCADALRHGYTLENAHEYYPKKSYLLYFYMEDVLCVMLDLEYMFNIELKDEELQNAATFEQMSYLIMSKWNEYIEVELEYVDELLSIEKINKAIIYHQVISDIEAQKPFVDLLQFEQICRLMEINPVNFEDKNVSFRSFRDSMLQDFSIALIPDIYFKNESNIENASHHSVSKYLHKFVFDKSDLIIASTESITLLQKKIEPIPHHKCSTALEKYCEVLVDKKWVVR